MANDISSINSSRAQQSGERSASSMKKDRSESGTSSAPASSSGSDKVSLTDTAARLQALEAQLTQQSEVDNAKVDEVQTAIANGEYKVNPKSVADKMLNFESSFQG